MDKTSKIYIAGHTGMVGSAIWRKLEQEGYANLIGKTSIELDLKKQQAVADFFKYEKPDFVFLTAAKVGGILANNTYRADFIYDNLMIQNNIIHESFKNNIQKLLFLGSSCIYPKKCPQPIKEEYLLSGRLEHTNEPYAIAKIAGIKMCENYHKQYNSQFFSIMPTNAYGPNDNYDFETSHVMAALMRKIYLGKCLEDNNFSSIRKNLQIFPISPTIHYNSNWTDNQILELLGTFGISFVADHLSRIILWGSGKPLREFIHVDDIASGAIFTMNLDFNELYNIKKFTHLNVGTGYEISIIDLAKMIAIQIGLKGEIDFDLKKLDGTERKCMSVDAINKLGWKSKISLSDGIKKTLLELI